MKTYRHGFTLIELLVVVAIIVVLISLLMPSLANAREQGYKVSCLSNARQLGMIFNLYMQDNAMFMPAHPYTDYLLGRGAALGGPAYLTNNKPLFCPKNRYYKTTCFPAINGTAWTMDSSAVIKPYKYAKIPNNYATNANIGYVEPDYCVPVTWEWSSYDNPTPGLPSDPYSTFTNPTQSVFSAPYNRASTTHLKSERAVIYKDGHVVMGYVEYIASYSRNRFRHPEVPN